MVVLVSLTRSFKSGGTTAASTIQSPNENCSSMQEFVAEILVPVGFMDY